VTARKALVALSGAMVPLAGAGVAYAASNSSGDEEEDGSYTGSVPAPQQNGSSR